MFVGWIIDDFTQFVFAVATFNQFNSGTSTFDGTAIAYAVIRYLAETVQPLACLSTHYHLLLKDFENHPLISPHFMDCDANDRDNDVTFLYRFKKGRTLKSHGLAVAKKAGLPESLISRAKYMSALFERSMREAHAANQKIKPGEDKIQAISDKLEGILIKQANKDWTDSVLA